MTSLWLIPADGDPVRVDGDRSVVGRDPHVDVVVNDNSVSRKHAVIERDSDTWIVADQKSANGTWIDGQRVIRAILKPGQQVRFGAVSFDVSLEKPAPRGRPARATEPAPAPAPPPAPASPGSPRGDPRRSSPSTRTTSGGGDFVGGSGGAAGRSSRCTQARDPEKVSKDLQRLPDPTHERSHSKPQAYVSEELAGPQGCR
jgi:hypothetical protein